MKKKTMIILTSVLLLLLFVAGGCGKKKEAENLILEMEENPTTGYTLSCEIKDESIVELVKDGFKAEDTDKSGTGGIHTYEFKGAKEGKTDIVFTHKQDWEGGETGDSKTVSVSVDKNLTVTED